MGFTLRAAGHAWVDGIEPSTLSVFQQRWWLEIARSDERYRELQVFRGESLVGRLPYVIRSSRFGLSWGASPHWCHLGGPVVSRDLSLAEKKHVLALLVGQLPARRSVGFTCGPHSKDAKLVCEAFVAAGFAHTIEETYSQLPHQPALLTRVGRKQRAHIEAARRALDIVEIDESEFIGFYAQNLASAALEVYLPLEIAKALIARGRTLVPPQVAVFAARRKTAGAPLDAAIACAWDDQRCYYWMSTRRRHTADSPHGKPNPDAIKLLIVRAMDHAKSLNLIFDVCGFNAPGAKTLYKDILRMPNEEPRDVFERLTPFVRSYRKCFRIINHLTVFRYVKRRWRVSAAR